MRRSIGVLITMNKLTSIALVFYVFTTLLLTEDVRSAEQNAETVAVAPDWQRATTSGDTFQLSQTVRERPVVMFFWASWCPYCKALMPHLQSIRLEYGEDIEIVAVQFKDKADAGEFMQQAGYDFTVVGQAGDIAELYQVFTTPGLLVINANQEIVFDLRDLPSLPEAKSRKGHSSRAAFLAPYWAANLRKNIDAVLR